MKESQEPVEYVSYPTPEPTLEEVIENHNQILEYHRQSCKHRPWLIRRMEERFKDVQQKMAEQLAKQNASNFDMEAALGF